MCETKVIDLPVGTKFYVVKGDWHGEVFEKNGDKWVRVLMDNSEYLIDNRSLELVILPD